VSGGHVETRPGWLLDELAHAGRENLDADHVLRYDDKMDSSAEQEVALLRDSGLTPESTVLDMGAGTGQFVLAVAPACRRVIAADVSPVMLSRLRAKVAAAGHANVECLRAGFLTYDHVGDPVDVVYSRYALHHLPDFWKAVALARLRQCLRPGGVLRLWDAVYSFDPVDAAHAVEAWCAPGAGGVEGEWSRGELEEHVRDEHSTFSWLLEPIFERTGFRVESARYSDDRIFATYLLRTRP
jgi:SAM-dependent methyltransferase